MAMSDGLPVHPLQAMLDGMSEGWKAERAKSQLTLGGIIASLEELDGCAIVALGTLASYRGYYSDLAFEPHPGRPVGDILADCRAAMGKVFEGYKGGSFLMGESTPLWMSEWGEASGQRIMRLDGLAVVTEPEDDDGE